MSAESVVQAAYDRSSECECGEFHPLAFLDALAGLGWTVTESELTLREAASTLSVSPATLRSQIRHGRLKGRMIGKTWTVTRREVERYRVASLGRVGRRAKG